MNTGMLWYDDDPKRTLVDKVRRAALHYERKYGVPAQICYVHPSALAKGERNGGAGGVRVETLDTVLINHLWVGREEQAL
jgi:hypothetical protein